jgi:hypothetical protein
LLEWTGKRHDVAASGVHVIPSTPPMADGRGLGTPPKKLLVRKSLRSLKSN